MSHKLFELPDITPKHATVKRKAAMPDTSVFRGQQKEAFDGIDALLATEGGCMAVLEGVGGSGKTFTTSRIIEKYLFNKWDHKVIFAATTNRAKKVAYHSTEFSHPCLDYSTIHSALALKEVIQRDGSIDFYPDKYTTPSIASCKVIFIDESSQFSKKLWGFILPYIDMGVKCIFIGDPYQTPPVKEVDSPVFSSIIQMQHNMKVFRLTEIIRQAADNPIIGVTSLIREHIAHHTFNFNGQPNELWQRDKGAYFLDRHADKFYFDELLKHIFTSANYKDNADFAKVVAWRHKTVNAVNKGVRRMLYGKGKLRRIEAGEKLVTKAPVFDKMMDFIAINNAEDLEVISFDRQSESINNGQYILPFYDTKVRYYDMFGTETIKNINIPTDIGMMVYTEVLDLMAQHAKTFQSGTFAFGNAWREFYSFQKQFANVSYAYAGTVHTAQGGGFNNTIVMNCDIKCNHRILERNKILYTGCSRAIDRLFII